MPYLHDTERAVAYLDGLELLDGDPLKAPEIRKSPEARAVDGGSGRQNLQICRVATVKHP
jgi:hypothetical protein